MRSRDLYIEIYGSANPVCCVLNAVSSIKAGEVLSSMTITNAAQLINFYSLIRKEHLLNLVLIICNR